MTTDQISKKQLTDAIKIFGYLISAILIILTVVGQYLEWAATPWLYLITLYFLTGCLWAPTIIKPFYTLIGKYFVKVRGQADDRDMNRKCNTN